MSYELHFISHAQRSIFDFVDSVLPEIHVGGIARGATVHRQRAERFLPALGVLLVGRRHNAARARSTGSKNNRPDAKTGPRVFRECRAAGHDQIGAKAIHRQGVFALSDQAIIQVAELCLTDHQKWK